MSAVNRLKLHEPVEEKKRVRDRGKLGKVHGPFLKTLLGSAGFTADELSGLLHTTTTNARGRVGELVKMGYAEDTRMVRKTRSGRNAAVWRLTKAGETTALSLEIP
jgi:predicted ArsR family transcriptional regulator